MTLRWRLTLNILALIAPLLLLLAAYNYYNTRAFMLNSEAARIRAQAKPIIDAVLLDQRVDDGTLRALGDQLATDLTSAETGAIIVDRNGQMIGRHVSEIGEPTAPELPREWYAPALRREREQNYVLRDTGGDRTLVVLVPIPPRQEPLGVVVLSTSLQDVFTQIRQHMLLTLLASTSMLLIAAVITYVMVRANLRPLDRMIAVAEQIARGDLSHRVRLPHGVDEIGLLAHSFDEMADNIQAGFEAQAQSETRLRHFLADVSHELRTPLTAIGGYIDLLMGGIGGAPGPSAPILRSMRRELDRTSRLVRDLLLLARSDRAATFNFQPVNLSHLCVEVAEQARLMLKGQTLHISLAGGIVVQGDANRIEQVLLNLLDNAIRHTPDGTQIELRLEARYGQACATISDTGPGIPPDILPHLFERFYRGRRDTQGERSSGLGLAIAKAIVEAHDGAITAHNQPGGGACFKVALPLKQSK